MRRDARSTKARAGTARGSRGKPPAPAPRPRRGVEARLAAALEHQAATAEILRIISRSPGDVQPVFTAIVASAARLCEAEFSVVARLGDGLLHLATMSNMSPAEARAYHSLFPRPPRRDFVIGRAVVDGVPVHVEDVLADPDYDPRTLETLQRAATYRTYLGIPIVRDGVPIGAIGCGRRVVKPFTDAQIELVKTFADQAVIAIENARLFGELQARNADLTETLEQQTATGEILGVISRSPTDVQPVFDAIARSAQRLCQSDLAWVFRFDGRLVHLAAHHGLSAAGAAVLNRPFPRAPSRDFTAGRAILSDSVAHIPDVQADADYRLADTAAEVDFRATLAVPMLRDGVPVGAISVTKREPGPFSARQIALLETFADQAVIAVENGRLLTELEVRNRDLTETLEQQTATSEILRVISQSPTDVQPVFETIAERARRLCDAEISVISRFDGELIQLAALHGVTEEGREAVRVVFPMHRDHETVTARTFRSGSVVHIADVLADARYQNKDAARTARYRGCLGVPMVREGQVVGVIFVARAAPGLFTGTQVELLKTFADQAVIAVENVRLFRELETRNRDLTETLEQQTATSELLKVIGRSTFDLQPVFETLAENAVRLCEAERAFIYRVDGQILRIAATHNVSPELRAFVEQNPFGPGRQTASARAALERRTIHIHDVWTDPEFTYMGREVEPLRTVLSVPMLRADELLGVIFIYRHEVLPFTDSQIALLETFADQAAIAIENARLLTELQTKNASLTEALEQQTATAEILRVISSSPTDIQPVLDVVAENAAKLCEADDAAIFRLENDLIRTVAVHGPIGISSDALPANRDTVIGRAILDRQTLHIHDLAAVPVSELPAGPARQRGLRTMLATPLLREGAPIGGIVIRRTEVRPFSERQSELLKTFADQAVIAIENVRLFTELEARNTELKVSLEQQTATSELLKVIGRSTFDLQPVFETLAENAVRLCESERSFIFRFDGQLLRVVATHNASDEIRAFVEQNPIAPGRGSATARAALLRRTIHVHDVQTDPEYTYGSRQVDPFRTVLTVPMLRADELLGVILIYRHEVRPFADGQIALLETFADQAAIAIENARLLTELQARTSQLTRSVQELQALGEVSRAVSSTLDLETVLATIVSRAVELSGSHNGIVYEFDEGTQSFHARATHQVSPGLLAAIREAPIRLGESAVGRAGLTRQPVEVADLEEDRQVVAHRAREGLLREGMGSFLAVPLVREDRLLGGLVIARRERGSFSPEVVATLQTFAAQSALAIHNAGLFREIQRQKQYSEALVETSPVAIATMDLHGTVVGWNPGAERLFGHTPPEALGRPMEDLVATPEIRDEVRANVQQTLAGEWIRAIARRARKDGSLVDVEISSVPVVVDGARVGMIGIYHDITELLEARREAEAANEAKSAFLATMSHEIRTPMNAVIGMSGLLLGTALTDEQREYAEVVRQSGDALLTVINDILDFSKIEAGKLELESQPFDVRDCVESALDLVSARAAEKGLDLAYLIADGTPAAIAGDITRVRQILLNLLSNAVKFTEQGEIVLSVSARRLDGGAPLHELAFSVRDTGIGIPPDRVGRLFLSFSQVDASTTRRYGGTGLGLAISQRLAELMGGRIGVTSEVGAGSDFRFTIRAPAAEAPSPARRDLTGVQPSLRGKRVLVVDDNATNRRILSAHLGAWGMPERSTGSPLEALEWLLAGERFDVAILDMHMPEMDGVALARAIREHPAGAALPLVLFTSLGRREARADDEGFAAYLHKPIKPSQLFDALVSVAAEQPVHVAPRSAGRLDIDPEMARRHPLRILLAEDNVVNQKVALRILAQMGYRADVAGNGLEAVDAVARQAYDVILMDVQMPEMDGFEASREINRSWPGARRPRIVAMTANAMQGDRELCEAAGMDDYVAKPIRVEELVAALERAPRRPDPGTAVAGGPPIAPTPGPGHPPPGGPESRQAPPAVVGPAPAPEGAVEAPAIDGVVIDRLVTTMGAAFVSELIDTFGVDAREQIAAMERAQSTGDVDVFRRAAHSLKSTSESLGATGLAAMARELEAAARTGRLGGTEDRVARIPGTFEAAARALGEIRRGLTA